MNLTQSVLLSTLLMALPVSAFAQCGDAPEIISSATMAVSGPNSPARTYGVKNLSVSASTNYSGYGQTTQDVSVSLALLAPPDAALLQWMKLVGPDAVRKVVITVSAKGANDAGSEIKYALDAARITNFSTFHPDNSPGEFMLQLGAANLVINGGPGN